MAPKRRGPVFGSTRKPNRSRQEPPPTNDETTDEEEEEEEVEEEEEPPRGDEEEQADDDDAWIQDADVAKVALNHRDSATYPSFCRCRHRALNTVAPQPDASSSSFLTGRPSSSI